MEASTTASSFSEERSQQQKASFDGWRFSNYSEYVQRKENNLTVKCTLCPGRKLLSIACNSTSNLKKHLQRQHGHIKPVAKQQSDMNEQPHKQQKLSFEHKVLPTSKSEINKLVVSYVVEEMLPLSTVESLSFRKIICKIPKAGTDQTFSNRAKCSALRTNASRSTVAAELVESLCGKKLMVPTVTRWNSFHNAVARITEISRPQLTTLCSQLGVRAFSEREYKFLVEYCTVTKPLTKALDHLQGENYCYYGNLLLTLESLLSKTLALHPGLSEMMANLPDVIVQAIKTHFASVLDSREGLLAAVTLTKFKMRWLREETRREALKTLLITECHASPLAAPHNEEHEVRPPQISPASSSSKDNFFVFEEEQDSGSFGPDREVMEYLKSGSEMGVLDNFPRVKNLSLKYNTAPASSAPVERLFSLGSLVLTPMRNRLGDKRFERLLLMRYNHYFDK